MWHHCTWSLCIDYLFFCILCQFSRTMWYFNTFMTTQFQHHSPFLSLSLSKYHNQLIYCDSLTWSKSVGPMAWVISVSAQNKQYIFCLLVRNTPKSLDNNSHMHTNIDGVIQTLAASCFGLHTKIELKDPHEITFRNVVPPPNCGFENFIIFHFDAMLQYLVLL